MILVLHKYEIRKSFHKIFRFCPKRQEKVPEKEQTSGAQENTMESKF